jgi:hypothetical protein
MAVSMELADQMELAVAHPEVTPPTLRAMPGQGPPEEQLQAVPMDHLRRTATAAMHLRQDRQAK